MFPMNEGRWDYYQLKRQSENNEMPCEFKIELEVFIFCIHEIENVINGKRVNDEQDYDR